MEPLAPHGNVSIRRGVILSGGRSSDLSRPLGLSGPRSRPPPSQMDIEEEMVESMQNSVA